MLDWDRRSAGTSASSVRPGRPSTSSRVWFPEMVTRISWPRPSHSGAGALATTAPSAVTRTYWRRGKNGGVSVTDENTRARAGGRVRAHVSPFVGARVVVGQGDGEGDSVLVHQREQDPQGRRRTEAQLDTQVLRL